MEVEMNVVIMGVQGSGKGTQAKKVAEQTGMRHINIGELFRSELTAESEIGNRAKSYISQGELVPDSVTFEILAKAAPAGSENLIFDGFPRTVAQAEYLLEKYKIKLVIVLDLSEEEAVKRISARRNCSQCKRDYNVLYKPPKKSGICDVCGGKLVTRTDDKPQEVKRRIEIYNDQAKKLLDYFEGKVEISRIDASAGINEIFAEILNDIGKN
jgi:adenylate kinase